ncbi:MAG TPA: inorganic diphosphatase [Patescibacteria group bacterium]|jgi:inorganic pyrophosphatase|nr:inorganic diphosphatase [Patescibacteria group bacterium]
MTDYNQILDVGDYQNGLVNTIVEISKGSSNKIEWKRDEGIFKIDRVEPVIFAKPANYGFIPKTLDEDGDELDTLIVTDESIPTGVWVEMKIIGVLNFEDGGDMDHKIIGVVADDRQTNDAVTSLDNLTPGLKNQIEHHFAHYKDLKKPGTTKVLGWGDIAAAKQIIEASINRYQQHNSQS